MEYIMAMGFDWGAIPWHCSGAALNAEELTSNFNPFVPVKCSSTETESRSSALVFCEAQTSY